MKLSDGTVLRITPAPMLATLFSEASDKINFRTKNGKVGAISLLDDSDSGLAMVMPAVGDNYLLFLYYADVHYRLMRIDLRLAFHTDALEKRQAVHRPFRTN